MLPPCLQSIATLPSCLSHFTLAHLEERLLFLPFLVSLDHKDLLRVLNPQHVFTGVRGGDTRNGGSCIRRIALLSCVLMSEMTRRVE